MEKNRNREGGKGNEYLGLMFSKRTGSRLASGLCTRPLSGEPGPNRLGWIFDRRKSGTVKMVHDTTLYVPTHSSLLFLNFPQIRKNTCR